MFEMRELEVVYSSISESWASKRPFALHDHVHVAGLSWVTESDGDLQTQTWHGSRVE